MANPVWQKLRSKEMTRKEFLGFTALAVASIFGIVGTLRELASHAATQTPSAEPEEGTVSTKAAAITDVSASGGGAVKFGSGGSSGGTGTIPGGAVAHGQQLTLNQVGPWTIQGVAKGSEVLSSLNPNGERISTYPTDGLPSWIPNAPYVYNNSTSNHGGIVPAGGMVIDGYQIPAGTWVVQFRSFTDGVIIEGDNGGTEAAWPGVVFRGCRMRGGWTSPGWMNTNAVSNGGIIWIMYADGGGNSTAKADLCETIFESQGNGPRDHFYLIRSYLSNATTLAFLRNSGDAAIENYGESVTDFGYGDYYHLNGIPNSGGQTSTLWLRNHLVIPQTAGSTQLTDLIQMAADGGAYPGTGTNLDGSTGYAITNNYLGGANYMLQLGYDKNNTVSQVRNVQITGNKFTTTLYANGGETGVSYKNPDFTNYGNSWSNNTWADGSKSGQAVAAPPASN